MMRTGLGKVRPSIVLKHFQYDVINAFMTQFHATLNFENIGVVRICCSEILKFNDLFYTGQTWVTYIVKCDKGACGSSSRAFKDLFQVILNFPTNWDKTKRII